MPRIIRAVAVIGLTLSGAFVFYMQSGESGLALAQTIPPAAGQTVPPPATLPSQPPTDLQCRGCHGGKTDTATFASGETVSLGVDLAVLDASPHSSLSVAPVACNDCHRNQSRYRYPHLENPARSAAEFAAAVGQNCQDCHYPHTPFHDTEQADYEPPTCVDCHGSHAIDRVENIADSMPGNCLACHSDQTLEWAQHFVAPRPGFGPGAAGYAGSARCNGCHDDKYASWQDTLHAKLIQNPTSDSSAVVGDFSREDAARTFGLSDVTYTLGSRWKQLYLTQTLSNTFHLLPAQWVVATEEWEAYHPEDWQTSDWRQECGSCHVTGLDTQNWTFTEFGIGCEGCHGPGAAHAADPENVKLYAEVDDQVCGACHSRGTSPAGYDFPASYQPGATLTDHFTFTTAADALWADGSAKWNHQQYMDWNLGSPMALAEGTNCTTCHAVHDAGVARGQLKRPLNDLCLECHNAQRALVKHTPFHEQAITRRDFTCADCHMPLMATSATAFDLHNHSFLQPNPQASVDHGVENMPNACNQCHMELGEDARWAAQTVAFAKAQAEPAAAGAAGPGPTPASPPPPTPIAAVGEPIIEAQVETGAWIRTILLVALGVFVLLVVAWGFYKIRARGVHHA